MKQRVLALGIAIAAAFAAFTIVVGCSEPMTLEKYFKDNPNEWATVENQLQNMSGETFSLDVTVEGNNIKQIMTYTDTFDTQQVAEMKAYFEAQKASLVSQLQSSIAAVEQGAKVDGVSWYVQFNNGDGSEIFSITIDKNTKVDSAPADTAAGTSGNAA